MRHRLVVFHSGLQRGENYGLFVQHVESLQWLFDGDPEWEVVPIDFVHPSFAGTVLDADLLVVTMTAIAEIEPLIRLRRGRGLRTVFEINDNVLAPGPWLRRGHLLRSPLIRQNILFYAWQCDALQVYAPALADLFRSVNPNVAVFDPYVPIHPLPEKPAGFVFGWGGTSTHRDDLLPIAPVVTRFCAAHPDAIFAFMGDEEPFDELFAGIRPEQKRWRPFGSFDEYLDFLRGLHVGLAPLRPSPFNATRTDTKFGTYAATGAAAILEDSPTYRPHGDRARLFVTPDELAGHLEELYADPDAVRGLALRAYAWACEYRSRDALHAQRERLYRPLVRSAGASSAPTIRADETFAPVAELTGRTAEETLAICRDLLRERPDYPQAQWLLARTLESHGCRAEALAYAKSIQPHPLYADLFAELKARLDPQHAAEVESPLRRLRLQYRNASDPLPFYRAVLEQQPYDFFALSAVIRLLSRSDPESPELDDLYARAALVAPESVPAARRPSYLEPFLPV